jgi:hypothetical protein
VAADRGVETTSMLSRDHRVFAAAMALETAHLLDDGVRDGGVEVASVVVALAIGIAAVALYGRLARGARAVLAGLFGLAGFVGALDMHVIHALEHGASGSDYSGFAHFAAGLTLLALAATLALRRTLDQPQGV